MKALTTGDLLKPPFPKMGSIWTHRDFSNIKVKVSDLKIIGRVGYVVCVYTKDTPNLPTGNKPSNTEALIRFFAISDIKRKTMRKKNKPKKNNNNRGKARNGKNSPGWGGRFGGGCSPAPLALTE